MASVYPPVMSPLTERSERLARLVYELLDAHLDTERLVRAYPTELQWRAHLSYLRDLQRIGCGPVWAQVDFAVHSLP